MNPTIDHFVLAENFTLGRLNRVKDLERYPGGKGVNISILLGAMGLENVATGFLGQDSARFVEMELQQHGVSTNFVQVKGMIRHNYYVIDKANGNRTLLDEEGPGIEKEEMSQFLKVYDRILARCRIVVLAGSLPRGYGYEIYCDLLDRARKKGVLTVLNTTEENMTHCLKSQPYLIMPDLRSADMVLGFPVGKTENRSQIACYILSQGAKLAVVTFDGINYVITGSSKYSFMDVMDWPSLVKCVKHPGNSMMERIKSIFVRKDEVRDIIDRWEPGGSLSDEEKNLILCRLNEILEEKDLYHGDYFAELPPHEKIRKIVEEGFEDLSSDEVQRYNRLLIDLIYPDDILSNLLSPSDMCFEAKPPQVKALSSLKTTDGMLAGMLYELHRGGSLSQSVKMGLAVSVAVSMSYSGVIKSMDDVNRYLDMVDISEVSM